MLILENFFDYFASLDFWQIFSIGLGTATFVIIIIYAAVFFRLRSKRLKTHEVRIDLNGGIFQGSDEELLLKCTMGSEIDITRIRPVKEGYRFNGFNVYKKYISSVIKEEGLSKSMVTKEELDGMDKSIIVMPDYDLTLVAKYSPLDSQPAVGLITDVYYPDFMSFEDLISELKHLNDDKDKWPDAINFKHSSSVPKAIFVFKKETICAILYPYKGITKVFFRTSDITEEKLLTPFYQTEDINDAMNWYSLVVIYNTKPSRFIRTFKDTYDGIDASIPTTEIEFQMIISSFSSLADPILDRAVLIVQRFEKDKLLAPTPDYVLKRELPPDLDENGEPRKRISQGKLVENISGISKTEVEQKTENESPAENNNVDNVVSPLVKTNRNAVPEVVSSDNELMTEYPYTSDSKYPEQRYFGSERFVVDGGSKECYVKACTIENGIIKGIFEKAGLEPIIQKPGFISNENVSEPKVSISTKQDRIIDGKDEARLLKKKIEPISVSNKIYAGKNIIEPISPKPVHTTSFSNGNRIDKKKIRPLEYKPENETLVKPIGPIGIKHVAGGAGLMTPFSENPELGKALLKELKDNPTNKDKKKKKSTKKIADKTHNDKKTYKK